MAIALIVLNNHISIVAQFGVLILLSTLTALVPYCFSAMTHLLLLFRSKNDLTFLTYARKLVITSVAFLFALFAIIGSGESTVYYGFLLLLAGLPVYIWMKAGSK